MGFGWCCSASWSAARSARTLAKRVEMTKMPELVAAMHSLIGLAAVCIAVAAVSEPWAFNIAARGEPLPFGNRLELFIGTFVGAITFSGSVIAFGKLSGKYKFRLFQGAPVRFKGQHMLNLVLAVAMIGWAWCSASRRRRAGLDAVHAHDGHRLRAGRADHHPDRRRRHAGGGVHAEQLFGLGGGRHRLLAEQLDADHRRLAGRLFAARSCSYIMCKAMNRSFFNVILGGFGGDAAAAAGGAQEQRPVKSGSADDAAFLMGNAESVIIVPGYGLAVARAQHALKELAKS